MTDIIKLAERCETEAGSRGLVAAIAVTAGLYVLEKRGRDQKEWFYPRDAMCSRRCLAGGSFQDLPAYTTSLDAALTLVPDGWRPVLDFTTTERDDGLVRVDLWQQEILFDDGGYPYQNHTKGEAVSGALALCAAAIRARAGEG